ncbi:S8 family serine peptidase, partial [Candidatus Woesebacteria bacterium]|nr:S8 family serine peptidase [Candidatus Woesebacteria bacterium]
MRLSRFKFIQQLLTLLLLIPLLSPPSSINVSAQVIDTGKQRETIAQRNPEKRGSSNSIIVKYKAGQSPKDIRKQVTERQVQSSSILGKMSLSLKNMQYQISGQNTPEVKLAEIDEIKVSNNLIEKPVFEKYEKQVRGVYTYTKPQNTQNVDAIIAQYEGLEEVEYAEVDEYSYATSTPQDEFYYKQWGMDMINAPQAWDISKGDSSGSMFIAIIDSGIAWDHPDLNSKIMAVYDKCDADPLDTRFDCRYQDGYDRDTHGTHVSGIAAAEVENDYYNGKYLGVAGAGYNTKIISIKALDNYGSGLTTWLASSLYGLANTFPGKKIVVNMSIAVNGSSQTLQDAIAAAHNAGFVLVAAAGNGDASGNGVSTLTYPAAYPDVIAVGALNRAGNKTGYSNFGANWVDVAAPGGDCSSYATRGDCILSTTS